MRFWSSSLLLIPMLLLAPASAARTKSAPPKAEAPRVTRWLVLGPVPQPLPAFADENRGKFDLDRLLDNPWVNVAEAYPVEAAEITWFGESPLVWTAREAGRDGTLTLERPSEIDPATPAEAWLAAYVTVDRFTSVEVELLGQHPRRLWVDGGSIARSKVEAASDAPQTVKGSLALVPGMHRLLVQTILDPGRKQPWSIGLRFSVKEGRPQPALQFSTSPDRNLTQEDLLDAPAPSSMAFSPVGKWLAITVKRIVPGTAEEETWIDVLDATTGQLFSSWRGGARARSVDWSPYNTHISWIADDAPGKAGSAATATLYVRDTRDNRVIPLLERVERLGSYQWSTYGKYIAYSTTIPATKDERGVKRLEGLMDRWADYRDKQVLHLVTVPGGVSRRLTAGALSATVQAFSPDDRRLLFTRVVEDFAARPYSRTELWEMELEGFTSRKLRDFRWFQAAGYSTEGDRIWILGGADEFDGIGRAVPEGTIANPFDGQLFIWTPTTDEVVPITRDFDPSVSAAFWNYYDGHLYFMADDREFTRLYRWHLEEHTITPVETGFDVIDAMDWAERSPQVAVRGSAPWQPHSINVLHLKTGRVRPIVHPKRPWKEHVRTGRVEPFVFTSSAGRTIDGRVYLPPEFDAGRRYPAIVFYYGGTAPVERDFGGRYPKEWWAANGYVVYVLQPTGAIGYGQTFSAVHVNDWGRTTSQEIIEGTRHFLEAHPFVDPERVGCIGASYGGFMTMLLATQTDLFAAAVSHAGISSLASYWGEGYWGYSYSSGATAESFPWNRRDVYVDQSPLFRADQVRAPILLTHGASDRNVPVGESDAFYVALKLLGKTVEYVQVAEEDHWILGPARRKVWGNTIVAWFDRWLKEQPEWWEALYPTEGAPAEAKAPK